MTTHGGHVGVAAGADQGAEVQIQVLAELQPAIGVRHRHRALDVVGHRLAGRVGEIIERQDDDVIAHADAAVLATICPDPCSSVHALYHLFVLRL